jgi:hypothetical protein
VIAMALFTPKNPSTVEAFPLSTGGDYVIVINGVATIVPKADFEAQYVPFVQG